MSSAPRLLRVLAVAVVLGMAGCIGDDDTGGSARYGGSIAIGATAIPTTLDPALAEDPRSLQLLRLVHTPLLSYRTGSEEDLEPVPGLARALPQVSDDGLVYKLRLRRGLRYSNGVPVRAGDFERAVERLRAMRSPLAALYRGIGSIDANGQTGEIRVTLARRDPAFAHLLALPSSAPLQRGTPIRDLSDRPPPGTGPYRIATVDENQRVVLRRWGPGRPMAGNVDRIAVLRSGPPENQAQAVLAGTRDVMQEPAPPDLLPELRSLAQDRYSEHPTTATVALVPDTTDAPLYDRSVRLAIGEALDSETLVRLYNGQLEPSCNLLPEGVQGYRQIDPCPYGDRDEPADLAAARDAIEEAAPPRTLVRVEAAAGVPPGVVRYLQDTLDKIGLTARAGGASGARLRVERKAPLLAHSAAYLERFDTVGDRELSEGLATAANEESPEAAAEAWAGVDALVVDEAYAIPLGYELEPAFLSERMDTENCRRVHPLFGLDLTSLCLR